MKTTIIEQLIVHDENGVPKGMLVSQAQFADDGTFVQNLRHELTCLRASEITAINAEKTQLETDKSELQKTITTLTTDKAELTSQVTTLESQLVELPVLQTQLAEALALVEEYRPYNKNVIRSEAFYKRLTGDELFKLGVLSLTDDIAKAIMAKLDAYLKNTWKVILDDPDTTQPIAYLQAVLPLTVERVQQILQPGTKEEAYDDAA